MGKQALHLPQTIPPLILENQVNDVIENDVALANLRSLIKQRQEELSKKERELDEVKEELAETQLALQLAESQELSLSRVILDLRLEKTELLKIIKQLCCSYEGNYQFLQKVEELLNKEIGFVGTYHPSQKMSDEMLTAVRGGM